jgi:hypothetical protein
MIRRSLAVISFMAMISTAGCSYQYIDRSGNHRIVGLANVTVEPSMTCDSSQLVSVSTFGLSAIHLPSHGGITLGYARNASISLPDNTLVRLSPEESDELH